MEGSHSGISRTACADGRWVGWKPRGQFRREKKRRKGRQGRKGRRGRAGRETQEDQNKLCQKLLRQ
eukprot:840924-Rhodomonas_salina.2